MRTEFEAPVNDDEYPLLCVCGDSWLHHVGVEIFDRAEDASDGLHVSTTGTSVVVNRALAGNPSDRRDGLIIYFECEVCPARPRLLISQHKGQTFFDFQRE